MPDYILSVTLPAVLPMGAAPPLSCKQEDLKGIVVIQIIQVCGSQFLPPPPSLMQIEQPVVSCRTAECTLQMFTVLLEFKRKHLYCSGTRV